VSDKSARRVIDARPVAFPAVIQRMNSVRADFAAPLDAVEALVPGDLVTVVDFGSRTAFASFIATHYVDADWGSFARASIVTSVRPRAVDDAPTGLYTCVGATSARFLNEVLYWVLGMHHVDATLEVTYAGDEMHLEMASPGSADRLCVGAPLYGPPAVELMTTSNVSYGVLDGTLMRTHYDVSTGVEAVDGSQVSLVIGGGPLGDALRRLGLSASSASWFSGKDMRMVLHEPAPVLAEP
jgi:hypothetical protein